MKIRLKKNKVILTKNTAGIEKTVFLFQSIMNLKILCTLHKNHAKYILLFANLKQ